MTITEGHIILAVVVAMWTIIDDHIVRNGPPGPPPPRLKR